MFGFNCAHLIPARRLQKINKFLFQNWSNFLFELSNFQNSATSKIFSCANLIQNMQHRQHFQLCQFYSGSAPSSISHLSAPICSSNITSWRNSKSPKYQFWIYFISNPSVASSDLQHCEPLDICNVHFVHVWCSIAIIRFLSQNSLNTCLSQ